MKILDVDLLQDGLQRNIAMLERLQNEVGNIQNTVKELVAMEEVLKGAGGSAIRGFYSDVHLPFLHFFLVFSDSYKQKLQQIEAALLSLEPDTAGYILEQFLEGELEQGLTLIANITERLTNEANSIMDTVSDIVALPHLNDSEVQEGVQNSKKKRDDTVLQLHEFDNSQTTSLTTVEADIQTMGNWLVDMEGMFTAGVKDITFQPSQWNAITFGSEIRTELFPKVYLDPHKLWVEERDKIIGTMITAKTFQALELKRMITIDENVGENIQYHQYENGLLIKEYSENGTVYYEIVSKLEYKEEAVQVEPPKENKLVDGIQFGLDLAGLIPGIGEIADGLNGVIYYARGDKLNAGLSFAAMVPFLGWGSTGTKIVNKGRNFFQPKNVLNDEVVESVSTSVYRDMANSPLIGSQSRLNLFTSLQNGTPNANNSPFMFNIPTSKAPSGGVHPEIQNPNVANKTPDLDGTGANSSKVQASAVQPPSKGNTPEAKSAVASPTKGNPNEQIQDLPKVVGGNGDHINLSNTTIPNKSTKTATTPTAKANNPAPVSSGKANVKSETPNSNIQAKPKVVGGNADYTAPLKNAKTINTPSEKVDITPTNKSIDSNVDIKNVDVETKGTGNRETEVPSAFRQNDFASSYEARYNQTPSPVNSKIEFEGIRGESLSTLKPPPDPDLKKILDGVGINGINYKNGVPDFSPVSKAQVEIDYMLGGKGTYGGKARRANFVQSDQKLANQINRSPELARQFGMEFGKISAKDIKKYREKNELTWHELNDVKTMQLVPTKINSEFGHLGGVGEINAGAFKPGGFANKHKEEILK